MTTSPAQKNASFPLQGNTLAALRCGQPLSFAVPKSTPPLRLDAALGLLFPELGLRARRRLWDWCRISVNNKAQKAGSMVRGGDALRIEPAGTNNASSRLCLRTENGSNTARQFPENDSVCLEAVAASREYIALNKPAGMHSAHIEGGKCDSLENILARQWAHLRLCLPQSDPDTSSEKTPPPLAEYADTPPLLLTRLDLETSGIVLAATTAEAAEAFRNFEKQGKARKHYLALVCGRLEEKLNLRQPLNTDGGQHSRIVGGDDPDPARHTRVQPLAVLEKEDLRRAGIDCPAGTATLVRVEIARGARHQIRAHLAHAGYPLVGEWLYADRERTGKGAFFLHHAEVRFPGFSALRLPDWDFLYEMTSTQDHHLHAPPAED